MKPLTIFSVSSKTGTRRHRSHDFYLEPDQVWRSEPGESRGAEATRADLAEMLRRPYTHGRLYTEEELWANFAYLMERLIPVAESADVRLALHPNDPLPRF